MKNSLRHIEFLDQLRGVAILAVLMCHTLAAVYAYDFVPWNGWFRDVSGVSFFTICLFPFSFGQAGVAIFFVISGFCIHANFQQPGQTWGSFFVRRFFRIYPAYIAATVFLTLLLTLNHFYSIYQHRDVWIKLLTHVFMVHNISASTFGAISGAFWSLAIEAQLYLLYPAMLLLVARLGWRRAMIILAAGELTIQGTNSLMEMMGASDTVVGSIAAFLYRLPFAYWFSWALGAYIADAFVKKQPLPFLKHSPVWWLALATATYFFKPIKAFWFVLFAMATAVFISRMLGGVRSKLKAPVFSLKMLSNIGVWSYSIYLLHMPLLAIYFNAIIWIVPEKYRSDPFNLMVMASTWLVIIPFSILWYKLFELPGIAFGRQIIQKKFASPEAALKSEKVYAAVQAGTMKQRHGLMIGTLVALIFASFVAVAKFTPLDPDEGNNLAWRLATSSDAKNRNGARAVELAEDACRQTQYKKTIMIGTLAAAYAEAGRFDEAIAAAQEACALAAINGETNLLQSNQQLLILYQNHQPYHERQNDLHP